jgi:hypothetical protein
MRSTAVPSGTSEEEQRPERIREQRCEAWSLAAFPGVDQTVTGELAKGPSGTSGDNRPYVTRTPSLSVFDPNSAH